MSIPRELPGRVYIAGTGRDIGKTTFSHGLLHAVAKRVDRVGYMKPVSASGVDHIAFGRLYGLSDRPEHLNPVLASSQFVKDFIVRSAQGEAQHETAKTEIRTRVIRAFDELSLEKDFVVIEGTGHSGVGYCFDLSNAIAATILRSRVVMLVNGGVGNTIDTSALHLEYFRQKSVQVMGVVINRVKPGTWEKIEPMLALGFKRINVDILGHLPYDATLAAATVREVGGEIMAGNLGARLEGSPQGGLETPVARYLLATMPVRSIHDSFLQKGSFVIVPAIRTQVIAQITKQAGDGRISVSGMVVVGKVKRRDIPNDASFPIWIVPGNKIETVIELVSRTIYHGHHKIDADDTAKVHHAHDLVERYVDVARIMELA